MDKAYKRLNKKSFILHQNLNYYELVGPEALRVFKDAKKMLELVKRKKLYRMEGIVGLYPANAVGDDIYVYRYDDLSSRSDQPKAILYGLRQQVW